jgi:hypothetical protein
MLRIIVAMAIALSLLCPLQAGIFSKKSKPSANQVAEWVQTVLNHPDAGKRAQAAEALADVDAAQYPEAIMALVEALQKDGSASVRRAAASSLGKLQPPSVEAAEALDRAIKHDDNWSVRVAARWARLGYRVPKQASPALAKPHQASSTPGSVPTTTQPASLPGNPRPMPVSTAPSSPAGTNNSPSSAESPLLFPVPPPSQLEVAPPPRVQPGGDVSVKTSPSLAPTNAPPATLQPPTKAVRPPVPPPAAESGPILVPPK